MALTYQTSWDSIPGLYDPQSEVTDALFGFISDPFEASSFDVNSLFNPEPETHFYSESETAPLPTLPNSSLFHSSIPSPYQYRYSTNDDFGLNPSKRYKICNDLFNSNNFFGTNSFATPSPSLSPSCNPVGFGCQNPNFFGTGKEVLNWSAVPVPVSAQSMAARERRKRISDKTQELGKLIPGGTRMNTAEMFHAAFNYVKFLQAQIGILTLMNSNEGGEVPLMEERMQLLLGSTHLQEKFSAEGKCLVPKNLVENLFKDKAVRSSVFVSRDLDRFVESIQSRV